MEHTCKLCGVKKDVLEFNKHMHHGPYEPWNLRYCKACASDLFKRRYAKAKNRKRLNESSSNWKKEHPEQHALLARQYRARNVDKIRAQNRLNYAIRKGRIERQNCEICGDEKSHAHHVSYDEWYNVRWLCKVCHKIEHG